MRLLSQFKNTHPNDWNGSGGDCELIKNISNLNGRY